MRLCLMYVRVRSKNTKNHTAPTKRSRGEKKSHQISSQNYQPVLVKTKRGRPWYICHIDTLDSMTKITTQTNEKC